MTDSLTSKIFNTHKTDYENPALLLGEEDVGMFDTIHTRYPELWRLYHQQKTMDWSEKEFNFSKCISDFKKCDRSQYQAMIFTLSWQMMGDSIASRNIAPVFAPFVSSTELWAALMKNNEIENLHAATYSEIVRGSFDDPRAAMDEILSVKPVFERSGPIMEALERTYRRSHEYALRLVPNDQETYNAAFSGIVALLLLERIQFLASFAVTFALADAGMFQEIGSAIRKIADDELTIHVAVDKFAIANELSSNPRATVYMENNKAEVIQMLTDVIEGEYNWIDYLFSEGRSIVGLTPIQLKQWVLYGAKDVAKVLKLSSDSLDIKFPSTNPLPYMEKWLNNSMFQPAPQEQTVVAYRLNMMDRDDEERIFDVGF